MCWKTLLLLLLCYNAQASVPHRWSRGEFLFLCLSDAHHSFLNTVRNLGGVWRGRKSEAPCPPLTPSLRLLYAS